MVKPTSPPSEPSSESESTAVDSVKDLPEEVKKEQRPDEMGSKPKTASEMMKEARLKRQNRLKTQSTEEKKDPSPEIKESGFSEVERESDEARSDLSSDDSYLEPEYESSEESDEDLDELFGKGDAHFEDDEAAVAQLGLDAIDEEEEKINTT